MSVFKRYLTHILLFLIGGAIFKSCTYPTPLDRALDLAGDNREELEAVLKAFEDDEWIFELKTKF